MAIVKDASGNSPIGEKTDNELDRQNVVNAGDPVGSVTPNYVGELLHDTTNNVMYRAIGSANTDWTIEKV